MIRGVIFDLGGTLITQGDFEEANAAALLRWLQRRGHALDEGFATALIVERRALWAARSGTREVTIDQALRSVFTRQGLPVDAAFLTDAEMRFFAPELEGKHALPGAVEALARLNAQGLRTALISNASSHYFVVECCRRLLFAPYLEPIVSSAAIGWCKPDPRIFHAALRPAHLLPAEVVMIGDTLTDDVAGAQAVGMRAILLTATHAPGAPTSLETIHPEAVAGDLDEAGKIIDQWRAQAGPA